MNDPSEILKSAARELEQYVDLQQKMGYIEYAASTQKELDRFNSLIGRLHNECICPTCGLRHGGSNVDGGF